MSQQIFLALHCYSQNNLLRHKHSCSDKVQTTFILLLSRHILLLSQHSFRVSSLNSLFLCRYIILNVMTKFFYHLIYSLSQHSYQVSRHSSCLPSSVLLQYSFPCYDNIPMLFQELFSFYVTTKL